MMDAVYWGKAGSGILFICANKILLVKRSKRVEQPETWGIPGGAIDSEYYIESSHGESDELDEDAAFESAVKETMEELGSMPERFTRLDKNIIYRDGSFTYITFLVEVNKIICMDWLERIVLNWENAAFALFSIDNLPKNLHFGVRYIIGTTSFPPVSGRKEHLYNDWDDIKQFVNLSNIYVNEQILEMESLYSGGVSDFGDPTAAFYIQDIDGYDKYRSDLTNSLRDQLGNKFEAYRSMTVDEYEEWITSSLTFPKSVTLDLNFAKEWHKFAMNKDKNMVIIRTIIEPEFVIMRGKAAESELIIDSCDCTTVKIIWRRYVESRHRIT